MKKSVLIVIGILLMLPLVSAGFFDWLTITGMQTAEEVFNVTLGNAPPTISNVTVVTGDIILHEEEGIANVTVTFEVFDNDGYGDIDLSTVQMNFSLAGDPLKTNTSCQFENAIGTKTSNFSCSYGFNYYDKASVNWLIGIIAGDNNSVYAQNNTVTVEFPLTPAVKLFPSSITWAGLTAGTFNHTADNQPTILNNTGNVNLSAGGILVNATDLVGESDGGYSIPANNFTSHTATGALVECTDGTALVPSAFKNVTGAVMDRGELGTYAGAQEELYYCLTEVASTLIKQSYSSTWTLLIDSGQHAE
ncbi:hypothetical protein ACFLZZ_02660 [Nanoarchaeota archaeon]